MHTKTNNVVLASVAAALLFPLFIQISGGIYNNPEIVVDSGGVLARLPLPLSLITCLLGVVVFLGNWRRAVVGVMFIAAFVVAMVISVLFAGTGFDIEQRKVLLAAQFLLPTVGLVLGLLLRDQHNMIARGFMWVLALLVPFQLIAGWWQKTLTLTQYLYVFSIYQHFQFVPVVFVMAYAMVMVFLWDQYKPLLRFLALVMGLYVIASASFLAIGLYSGFTVLFVLRKIFQLKAGRVLGLLVLAAGMLAAVLVVALYYSAAKANTSIVGDYGQYLGKFQTLAEGKMPTNIEERLADWRMYGGWIGESGKTLLFGHVAPPPREVRTSAHNWYLDLVYNFGLVSALPVLALIAFTTLLVWRSRSMLPEETFWLAGFVAFMVLVDSNFKVTLRQPYPGIFAYFLWGLLLSRLQAAVPGKLNT